MRALSGWTHLDFARDERIRTGDNQFYRPAFRKLAANPIAP